MTTARKLFGQDIALTEDFQVRTAASGELILTDGVDTANQDIRLRLFTPLGTLFYDAGFGSLVMQFIRDESSELTRAALCAEAARRIEEDAAVAPGTADCAVAAWDDSGVTLKATYRLIDEDHPYNLILSLDRQTGEMVVKDVNARQ